MATPSSPQTCSPALHPPAAHSGHWRQWAFKTRGTGQGRLAMPEIDSSAHSYDVELQAALPSDFPPELHPWPAF